MTVRDNPNSSWENQAQAPSNEHPCPECVGTMLPGITYPLTFTPTRGTGRVWSFYTGAANAYPAPSRIVECWRCKGTGLVEERRKGGDRRAMDGRRATDDYMGSIRATMRRRRGNTAPNKEVESSND